MSCAWNLRTALHFIRCANPGLLSTQLEHADNKTTPSQAASEREKPDAPAPPRVSTGSIPTPEHASNVGSTAKPRDAAAADVPASASWHTAPPPMATPAAQQPSPNPPASNRPPQRAPHAGLAQDGQACVHGEGLSIVYLRISRVVLRGCSSTDSFASCFCFCAPSFSLCSCIMPPACMRFLMIEAP